MDLERLSARKELIEFELNKLKLPDGSLRPGEELTEEAKSGLSDHERALLVEALQLWEEHSDYIEDEGAFMASRARLRWAFEELVLAGLLRYSVAQDGAVQFGAIPDPKDQFRFFRSVEGFYCCWTCGDNAMSKHTHLTVRLDQMSLSGPGKVVLKLKAWCPSCEPEPPNTGIIMMSQLTAEEAAEVSITRIELNSPPDA